MTRKLPRIEDYNTRTEIRRRVAVSLSDLLGGGQGLEGREGGREESEDAADRSAVSSRTKGAHVFLYDREKKNKNTKGGGSYISIVTR